MKKKAPIIPIFKIRYFCKTYIFWNNRRNIILIMIILVQQNSSLGNFNFILIFPVLLCRILEGRLWSQTNLSSIPSYDLKCLSPWASSSTSLCIFHPWGKECGPQRVAMITIKQDAILSAWISAWQALKNGIIMKIPLRVIHLLLHFSPLLLFCWKVKWQHMLKCGSTAPIPLFLAFLKPNFFPYSQ